MDVRGGCGPGVPEQATGKAEEGGEDGEGEALFREGVGVAVVICVLKEGGGQAEEEADENRELEEAELVRKVRDGKKGGFGGGETYPFWASVKL